MKSHIQFPKTLLKNFANSKNEIYYYDFKDNTIQKTYPKSFNVEEGYYNEMVEEFFSKNIESQLGKTIKSIKEDNFYENELDPDIRAIAKDYVYSVITRDPAYLQELNDSSIIMRFLTEEEKRNYVVPSELVSAHNEDILSIFTFGIGITEKAFVLNSNGIVPFENYILAPITPNRAFVFCLTEEQQDDTKVNLIDLTDETDDINKTAFECETLFNNRFLLANSADLLKQIIEEKMNDIPSVVNSEYPYEKEDHVDIGNNKCGEGKVIIDTTPAPESIESDSNNTIQPSFDKKKTTLIAHRGYSGIAPENTLASFRLAAAQPNFGAIECDVHRTRDGVYVIQHDGNLKRIFGLDRAINECSYNQIKGLFAIGGNNPGNYPIEDRRVCLLDQYMKILKETDKRAVIELKQAYNQDITNELFDMITSYGMNDRIDIISFSFTALDNTCRAMDTYVERHPGRVLKRPDIYLLTMEPEETNATIGDKTPVDWALDRGYNLSIKHTKINADLVDKIHEAGKKVNVWTVNNYEKACHYIYDLGVDCLTSNHLLFPSNGA